MDDLARAAFKGEPPPPDPLGRAQYYMMQRLYELHRRGTLSKANASYLKGLVLNYGEMGKLSRRELIDSFIGSWSREDLQRFKPEIKALSLIYLEELYAKRNLSDD